MKEKSKALRLSPVIPSFDLEKTRDFLVRALGFEVAMGSPKYVVLSRDGHDLHLCPAGDGVGQMSAYLEVDDIDSAWKHFSSSPLEGVQIREPFVQAYGMKEFHVELPETKALLFVGQQSDEKAAPGI